MHAFTSAIQVGGQFDAGFTQDDVKNEPMFFNSDLDFASKNGGPITRAFIKHFISEQGDRRPYVFDSRVHMLMPGWYPCIPGFHHDDVPRSTSTGQPNYVDPEYRSEHCLGLVNGAICNTQFAIGASTFSEVPEGVTAYKVWHLEVEQKLKNNELTYRDAPSGHLVYFNDRSWHQGVPAVANGWRWFARISWNTDRVNKITNEIRRQVQVYLEHPMEGW